MSAPAVVLVRVPKEQAPGRRDVETFNASALACGLDPNYSVELHGDHLIIKFNVRPGEAKKFTQQKYLEPVWPFALAPGVTPLALNLNVDSTLAIGRIYLSREVYDELVATGTVYAVDLAPLRNVVLSNYDSTGWRARS